jgi:hypothetical protein
VLVAVDTSHSPPQMILLDDPSLKSNPFTRLNTRTAPVVSAGRPDGATDRRSLSPLPDYETSEAQHNPSHRPLAKRIADARFWRATCVALAFYVGLTLVCGIPFLVVVSCTQDGVSFIILNDRCRD